MTQDKAAALLYLYDTVKMQQDTLEEAKDAFTDAGYAVDWLEGLEAILAAAREVAHASDSE